MNGAGIGDGLEVEQDKVGTGVLAPVQEQVGHADVGGVADRDETAEAQAPGLHSLDDGQPEGARLAEHARAPRRGTVRPKVALKRELPAPLNTPVQLGPTRLTPRSAAFDQARLESGPGGAYFRETGRYDTDGLDAEVTGLSDHPGHGGGRQADDDEIGDDRAGSQVGIGGEALHQGMVLVTGRRVPAKWLSTRLANSNPERVSGSLLAPTTAIARGCRNASSAGRTALNRSRRSSSR